ncbi:MAG: hypothetical protein II875_15080, partial [Clostridia bacterium]|nr:hypothetical protein [Clostridia bacterium]
SVARKGDHFNLSFQPCNLSVLTVEHAILKERIEIACGGLLRLNPPPSARTGHLLLTKGGFSCALFC